MNFELKRTEHHSPFLYVEFEHQFYAVMKYTIFQTLGSGVHLRRWTVQKVHNGQVQVLFLDCCALDHTGSAKERLLKPWLQFLSLLSALLAAIMSLWSLRDPDACVSFTEEQAYAPKQCKALKGYADANTHLLGFCYMNCGDTEAFLLNYGTELWWAFIFVLLWPWCSLCHCKMNPCFFFRISFILFWRDVCFFLGVWHRKYVSMPGRWFWVFWCNL